MKVTVSEIFQKFSETGVLISMSGKDREVHGIAPVERCGEGDLVFIDKKDFLHFIQENKPSVVVLSSALMELLGDAQDLKTTFLVAASVPLAHALIKQQYQDRNLRTEEWQGVHSSAVVHESARLGKNVLIAPGVVVGADAIIAANVVLMAGVVVEHGVKIGDNSVIHPNTVIGYHSEIGKNVVIKSGTVIGSEGFGYAQDANRKSHKIPQTGRVVIEDDVTIGSCCCIDRAAYEETRIGRGTKMDNLCHIAHNVKIGEDCLLTAGLIVAGSTTLGSRVITSGQTGILDHLKIGDDTIFLHRAGVTENISRPGAYAGLPLQPLQEYLRNAVMMKKLTEMRKMIRDLEKRLEEMEPQSIA